MSQRQVFMFYIDVHGLIYVKPVETYSAQGGFWRTWGKEWHPIVATSVSDAKARIKRSINR